MSVIVYSFNVNYVTYAAAAAPAAPGLQSLSGASADHGESPPSYTSALLDDQLLKLGIYPNVACTLDCWSQ